MLSTLSFLVRDVFALVVGVVVSMQTALLLADDLGVQSDLLSDVVLTHFSGVEVLSSK